MSNKMFYLKYRPRTLSEIDNSLVGENIEKILKSKSLPHAMLFLGPKGTGKTSTARIFAKAVNCTNNKTGLAPCNKCENCRSIDSSTAIDVIEMDAASNRGIEEIRNLIKESSFLPMNSKKRVFIIDEAHMITPDAFNALLKTLEEPPESVIFILATTNVEKIPKTIISRCFLVNFGKAKEKDIITMLKRVALAEKIKIDEALFKLIAGHADSSFRDAAKILEQLSIQNKLTVEEALEFLGLSNKRNLLETMQNKTLKDSLLWVEEFSLAGGNFKNLIEELLEKLRIHLLIKSGAIEDEKTQLNFTLPETTSLMKLFADTYNNLKTTPIDSIPLEIAIADFYNDKVRN